MKIVICGSSSFYRLMAFVKEELEHVGHHVIIPQGARTKENVPSDEVQQPHDKRDEFFYYYEEIRTADAVLVLNYQKNNIPGYVGGNTLIEVAFAYVSRKMIFLAEEILGNGLPYRDEIERMRPIYVLSSRLDEHAFRQVELDYISKRPWLGTRIFKREQLDRFTFPIADELRDACLRAKSRIAEEASAAL